MQQKPDPWFTLRRTYRIFQSKTPKLLLFFLESLVVSVRDERIVCQWKKDANWNLHRKRRSLINRFEWLVVDDNIFILRCRPARAYILVLDLVRWMHLSSRSSASKILVFFAYVDGRSIYLYILGSKIQ